MVRIWIQGSKTKQFVGKRYWWKINERSEIKEATRKNEIYDVKAKFIKVTEMTAYGSNELKSCSKLWKPTLNVVELLSSQLPCTFPNHFYVPNSNLNPNEDTSVCSSQHHISSFLFITTLDLSPRFSRLSFHTFVTEEFMTNSYFNVFTY